MPTSCPGVPSVLLQPALQWADKADFNDTLAQLARLFVNSFSAYLEDAAAHVGAEMAERILGGGPDMRQVGSQPQPHRQRACMQAHTRTCIAASAATGGGCGKKMAATEERVCMCVWVGGGEGGGGMPALMIPFNKQC